MSTSLSRRGFLVRIAALGGAGMATGLLAACGTTTAPTTAPAAEATAAVAEATVPVAAAEVVTLTMWKGPHKAAGEETTTCAGPTLDKFMADNPSIKVDFQEVPWSGYNEKFTSAFAAGDPPDVSYQTESFPTFVKGGNILPLDDLFESTGFDKAFMLDRAWELASTAGVTYAMPWIEGGSFMMYNKDLFEQAGLDPEVAPDTMEDFLDYAKKINDLGDDIYGYAVGPTDYHENGWWNIRWGGQWWNEDMTACIADSEEGIAGWQFMADLFHVHEVALPAAIASEEPGAYGYFRDGKVGMITQQSVVANSLRVEKPDFPLAGCYVPKGPAAEPEGRAAYGGVGMLAIAKATKHVEESWTLLNWLVTPQALKDWVGCLGFSCAAAEVFMFEDDPVLSIAEQARGFHFFWPYTEWVFKYWDIETTYLEAMQLGEMEVEAAVKEMVTKVNDMLKEFEGA